MPNNRVSIIHLLGEYNTNENFKTFVDKAMKQDGCSLMEELSKRTVEDYYLSVIPGGCNAE